MSKPGRYRGRHFTTYIDEVKELRRRERIDEAERLSLKLVMATEDESAIEKIGVAPWYYEELAKIYRKRNDYSKEISILERFAAQQHAPGVTPPKLLERLERARSLAVSKIAGSSEHL